MASEVVVPIPNRYKRSKNGGTVHKIDCRHAGRHTIEWRWAEGMDPDEIISSGESRGLHYHWCGFCWPNWGDDG